MKGKLLRLLKNFQYKIYIYLLPRVFAQAQLLKISPTPKSPFHQILHLAQCSQTSTVLLVHQTRPSDCRMVRCGSSLQKTCHPPALESSGGVFYTSASEALHRAW